MHGISNLVKKLSFEKGSNAFRVLSSYYYSRATGQADISGLPLSMSIEPTTSCNLRCPECPSGLRSFTRNTGMMDLDLFKKIVDDTSHHLIYLLLYFQGEPFLNKRLFEMIKYASSKKIFTATSTNGHYLTDMNVRETINAGLDELIVSIDGTSQATYEQYRIGGSLEKVIQGTKTLLRLRDKSKSKYPKIVFQFLVVKHNEHQIEEVRNLASEMGVDEVRFKTAQIYNYHSGSDLMPENEKYSRYKANGDGTFSIKNKLEDHCWKMWHSCVVTWDGHVVPCCFDKDASHRMGSLKEQSLKEIWASKQYKDFRRQLLNSRKEIDICQNCSEGTAVWA